MDLNTLLGVGGFWVNVVSLLIAVLALGFGVWTYYRSRQRRLITYEVEDQNTNVVSIDRDQGENIKIFLDDEQVEEVRYQLIKIRNEGNMAVDDQDYKKPLQIAFVPQAGPSDTSRLPPVQSSQVIIRAGIPEAAQPLGITSDNARDYIVLDTQDQFVSLKNVLLNAGDWIRIKVLTRRKVDINVTGQIKDGQIKAFAPAQLRLSWRRVIGYTLVGGLLFLLLYNGIALTSAIIRGDCVIGSIQVGGSSAFYDTANGFAGSYRAVCPVGFVNVDQNTSSSGLDDLKNGAIQVSNSEIPVSDAGLDPSSFVDNKVAVIVFTVIVSNNVTGIHSLTVDQLIRIYQGTYQNWRQVDSRAPDLSIKVYGRPTTSGTYHTFTRYVLGSEARSAPSYEEVDKTDQVASKVAQPPAGYGAIGYVDEGTAARMSSDVTSVAIDPGQNIGPQPPAVETVENNTYRFWAIEHMYTQKDPDRLATSFIAYVTAHIETNGTFIKLENMTAAALQAHG